MDVARREAMNIDVHPGTARETPAVEANVECSFASLRCLAPQRTIRSGEFLEWIGTGIEAGCVR